MINNRGPRMDPCGTPVVMELNSDACFYFKINILSPPLQITI